MTDGAVRTCPSCGAATPPDAQFCRECGAILVRGSTPPQAPQAPQASQAPMEEPMSALGSGLPEPRGTRRRTSVAIGIVAVALVAIVIALFSQRQRSEIPVPGEPAVKEMTPEPVATEAPPARVQPTRPPPPREPQAREPEPRHETDRMHEPAPPPEEPPSRRASRGDSGVREEAEPAPPAVESGEGGRALRAGWYRVKFRAPLFQSPSETAPVVAHLAAGTRVRVTHVVPGFLAVQSTTGKAPGYLSTDDAAPEAEAERPR